MAGQKITRLFGGRKGIVMDVDSWKDIVGHSAGPHHRSLMRSRWHNSLPYLSLSSSGWVYQRCPEYLTGKRAHPRDLICTGVHLVGVVWDNLHIMSHLHPGSQEKKKKKKKWHARPPARAVPGSGHFGGRRIVCRRRGDDQRVPR